MPFQFASVWKIVGGNVTPINEPVNPPFTITWDGPDLTVGEHFTIAGSVGSIDAIYLGVSAAGDISIQVENPGGQLETGMLTNNTFTSGNAAPTFQEIPFVCFLAGTRITTPVGEVAVETLAVGDLVLTFDGCAVPVKWIGRQTLSAVFGMPEGRRPVCIAAGALGSNLPARDLRLTADHALLIDNVLVQAGGGYASGDIYRQRLAPLL